MATRLWRLKESRDMCRWIDRCGRPKDRNFTSKKPEVDIAWLIGRLSSQRHTEKEQSEPPTCCRYSRFARKSFVCVSATQSVRQCERASAGAAGEASHSKQLIG